MWKLFTNRAFSFDVTAAMLVYQDKRILVHQLGRHMLCCFNLQGLSENALYKCYVNVCNSSKTRVTNIGINDLTIIGIRYITKTPLTEPLKYII